LRQAAHTLGAEVGRPIPFYPRFPRVFSFF
jgi:hypothetical protein